MKLYKTKTLNRASYLVYLGARYVTSEGSIDNAIFTLEAPPWVFKLEELKVQVDYIKFLKIRQKIKELFRIERGLPRRYHVSKPFTFEEIAHG